MRLDEAARGWLGVKWRHLGRNKAGVDCIGLVVLCARECGYDVHDPAPYAREPQDQRLAYGLAQYGDRVGEAQPGDVLLFRWGPFGGHLGIASMHPEDGAPSCIHAFAQYRTVGEHRMSERFRQAHVATYRIRG